MGCDTKGVLLTSSKNVMAVCSVVGYALDRLIQNEQKALFPEVRFFNEESRAKFQKVKWVLNPSTESVSGVFRYHGEDRQLFVTFSCDVDNLKWAPQSISMSMGSWGHSDTLMLAVLYALSIFGPVVYDYNDCDSIDAALLDERLNIMQLLALQVVSAHYAEKLIGMADDKSVFAENIPFEILTGMNRADFAEIQKVDDCNERWDALKAYATNKVSAPSIPALAMFCVKACKA
jgi:hypothetical protein